MTDLKDTAIFGEASVPRKAKALCYENLINKKSTEPQRRLNVYDFFDALAILINSQPKIRDVTASLCDTMGFIQDRFLQRSLESVNIDKELTRNLMRIATVPIQTNGICKFLLGKKPESRDEVVRKLDSIAADMKLIEPQLNVLHNFLKSSDVQNRLKIANPSMIQDIKNEFISLFEP